MVVKGLLRLSIALFLLLSPLSAAAGGVLWARQWGTPAWDAAYAVSGGRIAGWTAGSMFAKNADVDAFVVSAGNGAGWQSGWKGLERAYAIASDQNGYYWAGTAANGGGAMRSQTDAVIARMDNDNNLIWKRRLGGPLRDEGRALAPAPAGGVYLAGSGEGRIFTAGKGGRDVFVARFDSAGKQIWGVQWGGSNDDYLSAAAPDGAGGVYLAGYSDVDEDCRRVSERGFLLRFSADGDLLWSYRWGYDAATRPTALAGDKNGVWVAGATDGSLYADFAGGGRDVFVAFLSAKGELKIKAQWGSPAADIPHAAVLAAGRLYLAGATSGNLFAENAGGYDAFVASLSPKGLPLRGWQFGGSAGDEANAIGYDGASLLVAGLSYGNIFSTNSGGSDAWAVSLSIR